jgi:oxygen-independent coproporphyrinogen-3 oxidase
MPFHLYLHMPYCRRKCPYCDFFKRVPQPGERERYIQALSREMRMAANTYAWATGRPATIYFGGGTPSLHTAEEIRYLLHDVRQVWGNDHNPNLDGVETTLETNPGTADLEKLTMLRRAGVNRLSVGAQSFSDRKLGMLYRDHTPDETRACVQMAHDAGFLNLSLDLIFGLPGETLEEWTHDIYHALSLKPEHVSLYNLEFHEGTVFDRWKRSGRLSPLDEDLEAEMYLTTHEILTANGYLHYEVSNFARPGFESIHNFSYWRSRPYLGVGPSAHSFDGNRLRFSNTVDMHEYFAAVLEGRLPVAQSEEMSDETRAADWISLRLRTSEGIKFTEAKEVLGGAEARELWRKAEWLPQGSRVLSTDQLQLTAEGWFRENEILLRLMPSDSRSLLHPEN